MAPDRTRAPRASGSVEPANETSRGVLSPTGKRQLHVAAAVAPCVRVAGRMSTPRPGPRQANALSVSLEIECSLLSRRAMSRRRYAYARGEPRSVLEIRSMAVPTKQSASHLRASLEVPGETSRIRPQAENSPAAMLRLQAPDRSAKQMPSNPGPGAGRPRSRRIAVLTLQRSPDRLHPSFPARGGTRAGHTLSGRRDSNSRPLQPH